MALRIDPISVTDPDAVAWLEGLLTSGYDVGSWIPDVFPRYARVLHPAHAWDVPAGQVPTERAVRGREIASWSGKALTRLSCIHDVATRADGTRWSVVNRALPMEGELVQPHLDLLTRYLTAATSTPDAVSVLVWSGYGVGTPYVRTRQRRQMPGLGTPRRRFAMRRRVPNDGCDRGIEISPRDERRDRSGYPVGR